MSKRPAAAVRRFFVGGNWKCNGSLDSTFKLVEGLNSSKMNTESIDVVVAPTFLHLLHVKNMLSKNIQIAAQNCYSKPSGAFTGEVSGTQLMDAGVAWVILGHSERRHVFKESEEFTNISYQTKALGEKLRHALDVGLSVIYCIGELLEQREAGDTKKVIELQCENLIKTVKASEWSSVVIAYEPVWAIGTGRVATPAQAQEVHAQVRTHLSKHAGEEIGAALRIIYGGSVKPDNCDELAACNDLDGFLVGGASLIVDDFVRIVAAKKKE